MTYNPHRHHRRSIRLKDYDYSKNGAYFITLCTENRTCLFGEITDGTMELNDAGKTTQRWWVELENKYSTAVLVDTYVMMPNHVHGILCITGLPVGADRCVCPDLTGASLPKTGAHIGAPLPKIMQWFKTMTTNDYIRGVRQNAWPAFNQRLWQRNYYERVIRNHDELNLIRRYVSNNPLNWGKDPENPLKRNK